MSAGKKAHAPAPAVGPRERLVVPDQPGLILTRRPSERILIRAPDGSIIVIAQLGVKGNQVKVGLYAPRAYQIDREEILARKVDIVRVPRLRDEHGEFTVDENGEANGNR